MYLNFKYIWQKLKKIKIKRDVFIFTIFLLLSALFWLLNALRETYSATFTIPIEYINVADDEAIVEQSHDVLKLKAKGSGYTILRQKVSKTARNASPPSAFLFVRVL